MKRSGPDLKPKDEFLCTRVSNIDEDDWNKVTINNKCIIGSTEMTDL